MRLRTSHYSRLYSGNPGFLSNYILKTIEEQVALPGGKTTLTVVGSSSGIIYANSNRIRLV